MNPYTFVPLAGPPIRRQAAGNAQFSGHSGWLRCQLTVQTPLFVFDPRRARPAEPPAGPGHVLADFPTDAADRPLLQGTALRGAVRSVAEAASRSCLALFDGHYEHWTVDYRPRLSAAYRHCESGDHLCPACRLFGTTGSAAYAGAVAVSDAVGEIGAVTLADRVTVSAIQSPKPHHQAFYLTADGDLAGRKFYYHQPNGPVATIERSRFTRTVQPIAAGSTLTFTISYRNLREDDVQLLLYSVLLEPGLGHKLGMGKPVGLGSVTLDIQSARNSSAQEMALGQSTELTDEALRQWIEGRVAPLRAAAEPHLAALRAVLALDPGRSVAYPAADWFRSHPTAPLSDVPDLAAPPPAPRRALERPATGPAGDRQSRPVPPTGMPGRRAPAPSRAENRRGPSERPDWRERPARDEQRRGPRPAAEQAPVFSPSPAEAPSQSTAEEVIDNRPATLADLVRRFSAGGERPERADPTKTKESVRAREEQRRLMERLRRREE
jgi:CRISPR/Cas system CSM-associated protein Csm3 (group 7 of RAMP superfamily)